MQTAKAAIAIEPSVSMRVTVALIVACSVGALLSACSGSPRPEARSAPKADAEAAQEFLARVTEHFRAGPFHGTPLEIADDFHSCVGDVDAYLLDAKRTATSFPTNVERCKLLNSIVPLYQKCADALSQASDPQHVRLYNDTELRLLTEAGNSPDPDVRAQAVKLRDKRAADFTAMKIKLTEELSAKDLGAECERD